jgi:L-alanine-DL-glutamate epimerase-like enolase superfamily enzyme
MLNAICNNHPGCSLILDANGGYNADEALDILQQLHGTSNS